MELGGHDLLRIAREVAEQFAIEGAIVRVSPLGTGLIHRTYLVSCGVADAADAGREYVLQRINTNVFRDPVRLMQNVDRIVAHLQSPGAPRPSAGPLDAAPLVPQINVVEQPPPAAFLPNPDRKGGVFQPPSGARVRSLRSLHESSRAYLTLVPTRTPPQQFTVGLDAHANHGVWRMYDFIANALCLESPASPEQAYEAAAAIGDFQLRMATLPPTPLHDTIPAFHDTPARNDALEAASARDAVGRAARVGEEIAYLRSHRTAACRLIEMQRRDELPTRIVHNDAKMSNVLLSRDSGEWLCVVDLDTVMPGLVAYDFGDMIRSMSSATREDEPDISLVAARAEYCEALIRGYLSTAAPMLTSCERGTLIDGAIAITLEQAARFLTDYLDGDMYYATTRPDQNFDRTRTQLALVRQLADLAPRLRPLCD